MSERETWCVECGDGFSPEDLVSCDLCEASLCRDCIRHTGGGGGGDVEWDGPDCCPDDAACEERYEVRRLEREREEEGKKMDQEGAVQSWRS
jgi:hypothetical protein